MKPLVVLPAFEPSNKRVTTLGFPTLLSHPHLKVPDQRPHQHSRPLSALLHVVRWLGCMG